VASDRIRWSCVCKWTIERTGPGWQPEYGSMIYGRGKPKYSEWDLSKSQFVQHEIYFDYPRVELEPPR
jgi:hypothetical protein